VTPPPVPSARTACPLVSRTCVTVGLISLLVGVSNGWRAPRQLATTFVFAFVTACVTLGASPPPLCCAVKWPVAAMAAAGACGCALLPDMAVLLLVCASAPRATSDCGAGDGEHEVEREAPPSPERDTPPLGGSKTL
jgi:hypothetical protein